MKIRLLLYIGLFISISVLNAEADVTPIQVSKKHPNSPSLTKPDTNGVKNRSTKEEQSSDFSFSREEQLQTGKELRLYFLVVRLLWYAKTQQFELFLPLFQKLRQEFPTAAETDYFKAMEHQRAGRNAKALAALRRALARRPDFARAWNLRGLLLSSLERYADARICFQEALRLNRYHPSYVYNLAFSLHKVGENEEALQVAQRASQLKPNFSKSHYLQALVYRQTGKPYKAFASFTLADEFGQDGAEFFMEYLATALELDEEKEVLRLAKLLSREKAKNAAVLRRLAQVWYRYGKYKKARKLLGRLVRMPGANWEDKKRYVYAVIKSGHSPDLYIARIQLNSKEKEALLAYAQKVLTELGRKGSLKAKVPASGPNK